MKVNKEKETKERVKQNSKFDSEFYSHISKRNNVFKEINIA